jgi:hypothetical protein
MRWRSRSLRACWCRQWELPQIRSCKLNLQTTTALIGKRASLPWQMTARLAHPLSSSCPIKVATLEFACHQHQKPPTYSSEYPKSSSRTKTFSKFIRIICAFISCYGNKKCKHKHSFLVYTAYFEFVNNVK